MVSLQHLTFTGPVSEGRLAFCLIWAHELVELNMIFTAKVKHRFSPA